MQADKLRRLHDIVDAASLLGGHERADYLDAECAGDSELRRLADGMLAELDTDDDKDSISAAIGSAARDMEEGSDWIGKSVGPYKIVERIADGGMGSVFRAVRADGELQREVAVKVLRSPFASKDVRRRFLSERQILADLNHPYICNLLDGGTTAEGYPFLAMELVEGKPIDQFCDDQRLSTQARLELFAKVCAAVEHAHRNLIVHRDLKPSNIIVQANGDPKLLDFGIAKLLDDDARMGHTVAMTQFGMRVMTPEYASPEQVRGESITTAADVYSLGVLLYQLLTGHSPYRVDTSTVVSMERAICETEPRKPSTVVASDATNDQQPDERVPAGRLAEARSSSPARLKKTLAGDLDNIVLMAMRKEPERRYRSVQALSQDIRHFLDDAPVSAHPTSWRYHLRKFLKRNAFAAAGSAAAVLAIAGLVAYYTVQVTRERDRAQLEARKAAQVSQFLTGLFEVSDPGESVGETITARSLLDQGAQRIDSELADQPAVRAAMQDVMGGVYRGLGLYDESQRLLDAALETRRALYPSEHPDVLDTLQKKAALAMSRGDYPLAEQQVREALPLSRKLYGEEHAFTADLTRELAASLQVQGEYSEAESLFREALSLQERLYPGPHEDKAATLHDLGSLLGDQGRLDEAAQMLRQSVVMLENSHGKIHPTVAAAMNDLAYVLQERGDVEEAESVLRQALGISLRVYGDVHPQVNDVRFTLASVVQDRGDPAEAESIFRQVLATDIQMLGEDHPYIALGQNNLASSLSAQGKYAEAEALYRSALALNTRLHGDEHPEVATSLSNLGVTLGRAGKFEEAGALFDRALNMRRKLLGEDHPASLTSQNIYALHLAAIGRTMDARTMLEKSIAERTRALGPDHPHLALSYVRYAALLVDMGEAAAAEDAVRRGIAIQSNTYGPGYTGLAESRLQLARALAGQGRDDEAAALYAEVLAAHRAAYPAGHPLVASALSEYGRFLSESGDPRRAVTMLREALAIRQATLPPGHWQIGAVESRLGSALVAAGELREGRAMLEAGHQRLLRARGQDSIWTRRAASALEAIAAL